MSTGAELAALVATALALVSSLPQVRRIVATGDVRGVSLSFATLGVATEAAWIAYAIHGRLWAALPEAVAMVGCNVVLAVALVRAGVTTLRPIVVGAAWAGVMGATAAVEGASGAAVVLAGAYAVQTAPSIWSAYRTYAPSGVAALTWALVGVEAILWGVYGFAHDDLAMSSFAVIGSLAAVAILARKVVTRNRAAAVQSAPRHSAVAPVVAPAHVSAELRGRGRG